MTLYLDYNATSPVHPQVLEAMMDVYEHSFGNAGSRTHIFGQTASKIVEDARKQIADLLRVDRSDVVFTSGATESDNISILGLAEWGKANRKTHLVTTAIEHKAVLEPMAELERRGFSVDYVYPHEDGSVSADDIMARVHEDTLLVSVMHANNETGSIQPVIEIGEALSGTTVYFHVDAAQTFGKLVGELTRCKYDMLSVSAHKVYGPEGVGALVLRRRKTGKRPPLSPIMYGGGQEGGIRPGTLPVALIAGFGTAASMALANGEGWERHYQEVKSDILEQLRAVKHHVNGRLSESLSTCLNVSFDEVDSEALMLALRDDIAVSNGSACTSASYSPSHVLRAMGLNEDRISGAIRMSWGYGVDRVDLTPLVKMVRSLQ
jgi:cysteine desulfurase